MKAIGVIPARYASTRLPGKPLVDIEGKPMIVRVYERAKLAETLDDVLVATDDERIARAVEEHGGAAVMTSKDHPNGTSRLAQVAKDTDAEIFINIQGDEPLLDPLMVDLLVEAMKSDPKVQIATLGKRITLNSEDFSDENVVKVVVGLNGNALYFSRAPIPYPRHPEHHVTFEHIGIYGYTKDLLLNYSNLPRGPLELTESLEQLRFLENGYAIRVIEYEKEYEGIGVDTEKDLERVRRIYRELMKK